MESGPIAIPWEQCSGRLLQSSIHPGRRTDVAGAKQGCGAPVLTIRPASWVQRFGIGIKAAQLGRERLFELVPEQRFGTAQAWRFRALGTKSQDLPIVRQ